MTRTLSQVAIAGAGVSGLTTGIRLAEAGVSVDIVATRLLDGTTSCRAGAIWGPHLVNHHRVAGWAQRSLAELKTLTADPAAGVHMVTGIEASRAMVDTPDWMKTIEHYRPVEPTKLPAGFAVGWQYRVPIVDMPKYLRYLTDRFKRAGGKIHQRDQDIASLGELAEWSSIVVNCTGMGSLTLVPDPTMRPVRGDLVVVKNPGVDHFFAEYTDELRDQTYILPQGDFVVLGGTAFDGDASLNRDPAIARGIVERAAAVDPRFTGAKVLDHRVGIRPTRPEVRVERQDVNHGVVIHNYGHGGGGVSLSWGCADEVFALVQEATSDRVLTAA